MSETPAEVTLADVVGRLDDLRDLFRRRLLDDRDKRRLLHELAERAERADRRREPELLTPLVRQLALVMDRMDDSGDPSGLAASFADEIVDILAIHGIAQVAGHGPVDPQCHEVAVIEAEPARAQQAQLLVARVLRRGFMLNGRVVRPAQVVARWAPGDSE